MDIQQNPGHIPGLIGEVVLLHGAYYAKHWNFGQVFEIQVARELSEFMRTFDPARDGFWAAMEHGRTAGFLALDATSQAKGEARLRWFIMCEDFRGQGAGKALLERAMRYCRERGYKRVFLWTFKGLEGARKLYESAGFVLTEEHPSTDWGPEIIAQKYEQAL